MQNTTAKNSKSPYPEVQKGNNKNLLIIIVVLFVFVSFVGLAGLGIYSFIKNVSEQTTQTPLTDNIKDYVTEFRTDIPSSCGYTIGRSTTVLQTPEYKDWTYEERFVKPEAFRGLVPANVTSKGVLLTAMSFKGEKDSWKVADENKTAYQYGFPGVVSLCVNNPSKWSLEDFVSNMQKISTDNLTYTLNGEKEAWGEITVQPVNIEGIFNGSYINEPFYLAVTSGDSNFSRLIMFQLWKSEDARLSTDLTAISGSLKNRSMISALVQTTTSTTTNNVTTNNITNNPTPAPTPAAPSCTNYKIYEGDFKSDKCYSSKDLQDLQYYVQQYNSAVFSANAAASSMKITCDGSDFFKDRCSEYKKQYEDGKKNKDKYADKIKEIIAKGK